MKICNIDLDKILIIAITGYTVNKKPILDFRGFSVFESVIAANILIYDKGVTENHLITESFSQDTIGNIY